MPDQALPAPENPRWAHIIDLGLTIWILRVPVAGIAIGLFLLWLVPQAQDLLLEFGAAEWGRIVVFFLLLFFMWALPTHYCARLLIDSDERYAARLAARQTAFMHGLAKWSPRVLGALPFMAMLGAVWRSWLNFPDLANAGYRAQLGSRLIWIAAALAISFCVFLAYAAYRDTLAATRLVRRWETAAARPMRRLRRLVPPLSRGPLPAGRQRSDLGPLLLLLMGLSFLVLPLRWPLIFADWFPRASSVPFVLGGWMPLLSYLAGLGRRLHAPLIAFGFLTTALLPFVMGDSYEVRRLPDRGRAGSVEGNLQALALQEAVARWKRANGCETGVCPRPIVVAAAGGASRAGFFSASVLGQMLDDTLGAGTGHGLRPDQAANRLFALSTVSGSSVGAIMTAAALAAASDPVTPPCVRPEPLWHGDGVDLTRSSWRACLQALMSGDFLTPVFAGFVFRDPLRFLGFAGWSDRGTLLERSWEEQFARLIGSDSGPRAADCRRSLDCGFRTLQPGPSRWLPILVLNGTSVSTGQRIVTTVLAPRFGAQNPDDCPERVTEKGCPIFAEAFDFHADLLDDETPASGWQSWLVRHLGFRSAGRELDEVRISTAAHNSARFPLISPPGEVRNRSGNILDRIVDGGYFENFGAQSAVELARALRMVDRRLTPFVLILSNDPEIPAGDDAGPRLADVPEGGFLTDLSGPAQALLHTRGARGTLAVEHVEASLEEIVGRGCGPNSAHIRVWPEYIAGGSKPQQAAVQRQNRPEQKGRKEVRPLSMSWWLSKPVQIYLHEQTSGNELNRQEAERLVQAFGPVRCQANEPATFRKRGVR